MLAVIFFHAIGETRIGIRPGYGFRELRGVGYLLRLGRLARLRYKIDANPIPAIHLLIRWASLRTVIWAGGGGDGDPESFCNNYESCLTFIN